MPVSTSPVGTQGTTTFACVYINVCVCVCVLVPSVVWICRRPAYHSPWAHEGQYGGWGLGAADMTAQFKEMEQEMQAGSKQSGLYIHLGRAWENSAAPVFACGYRQGGKWTYRCCIVLLRLRDTPESVIC